MKILVIILAFIFIASCDTNQGTPRNQVVCLISTEAVNNFSNTLFDNNVPHKKSENDYCIYSRNEYTSQILELHTEYVGTMPPWGLNVGAFERNPEIIKLLNDNGVETTLYHFHGTDFIVWSYEDHEKAESILGYDEERKSTLRGMREDYKRYLLTMP